MRHFHNYVAFKDSPRKVYRARIAKYKEYGLLDKDLLLTKHGLEVYTELRRLRDQAALKAKDTIKEALSS